jgi:hypothetical protein
MKHHTMIKGEMTCKNIDQNYEDQFLSSPNLLFSPWAYALLKVYIDFYYLEESLLITYCDQKW